MAEIRTREVLTTRWLEKQSFTVPSNGAISKDKILHKLGAFIATGVVVDGIRFP